MGHWVSVLLRYWRLLADSRRPNGYPSRVSLCILRRGCADWLLVRLGAIAGIVLMVLGTLLLNVIQPWAFVHWWTHRLGRFERHRFCARCVDLYMLHDAFGKI